MTLMDICMFNENNPAIEKKRSYALAITVLVEVHHRKVARRIIYKAVFGWSSQDRQM